MSNMLEKTSTTGDILKSIYMARRGSKMLFRPIICLEFITNYCSEGQEVPQQISEGDLES